MIKVQRSILLGVGALSSENPANIPTNFDQKNSGFADDEISLKSLTDVKWITNAIEPEQQRGPSENS